MERNNDLTMLAKNATIQLGEVPIKNVSHFRPRKGEDGCAAAIIRLRAREGSPYAVMVFDEREDSVNIASAMANILNLERNGADLLDKEAVRKARQEAHDYWPRYLGFNASVHLGYDNNRRPVLVLRDPEDVEVDGLLKTTPLTKEVFSSFTVRQSGKSWMREVMHFDEENKVNYFLLVTLTNEKNKIVVFHREIRDGVATMTDYIIDNERRVVQRIADVREEVWLEGEPNQKVAIESENKPEEIVETPPTDLDINLEKPAGKKRSAKKKVEPVDPDDVGTLEAVGLKNGDLEKLANAGITSTDVLLEKVEADKGVSLAKETGIAKSRLLNAVVKIKAALKES